jgi:hypothetical protein
LDPPKELRVYAGVTRGHVRRGAAAEEGDEIAPSHGITIPELTLAEWIISLAQWGFDVDGW